MGQFFSCIIDTCCPCISRQPLIYTPREESYIYEELPYDTNYHTVDL